MGVFHCLQMPAQPPQTKPSPVPPASILPALFSFSRPVPSSRPSTPSPASWFSLPFLLSPLLLLPLPASHVGIGTGKVRKPHFQDLLPTLKGKSERTRTQMQVFSAPCVLPHLLPTLPPPDLASHPTKPASPHWITLLCTEQLRYSRPHIVCSALGFPGRLSCCAT